MDGISAEAAERAEWWQRHLTELLTGRADGDADALVKAEYDPAVHSLRQREPTKLAELRAAGQEMALSTLAGCGPASSARA